MIVSVNVFAFSMKLCLDNCIAELLSQKIEVGSFAVCPISFNSLLSQTAWQAAVVAAATYSASAEDMLTMVVSEMPKRSNLYPNGKHNQMCFSYHQDYLQNHC